MALTALCYNWGFFTILGYAPFPMELSPIKLGLVFFGWGIIVAVFAVFGAPWLQRRLGIARTMYANLFVFALISLGIAIWTLNKPVLIILVIVSGIVCGVNNTVTTQAVMTVSPVERPVASAAYSFVRFIGGGLAPYVAGRLVLAFNIHVPFYIGRRGDPARHRHPVHRPQAARRGRADPGRGGRGGGRHGAPESAAAERGTRGRGEGRGPARRRRLKTKSVARTNAAYFVGQRRHGCLGAGVGCPGSRYHSVATPGASGGGPGTPATAAPGR